MADPARQLHSLISDALQDERLTPEILAAALGVLESVTDHTANLDDLGTALDLDLPDAYDRGRDVGAKLPGGVDVENDADADAVTP